MDDILLEYQKRIDLLSSELQMMKNRFAYMYIARLLSFIMCIAFIYIYYVYINSSIMIVLSIASLATFLILIKIDSKFVAKNKFLETKLEINQNEVKLINGNYSQRKSGEEYNYINPHLIADFEILGIGSLFQLLNRTSTKLGEKMFINNLCNSELNKQIILDKQAAISELKNKIDFVQNFQVYGSYFNENNNELEYLSKWIDEPDKAIKRISIFCIVSPLVTLCWLLCYLFFNLPGNTVSIPIIINLMIVNFNMKNIENSHAKLGKTSKIVKKYTRLISLIEIEKFNSKHLIEIKSHLYNNNISASKSINKLFQLLNSFDTRYNLIASFILNSLYGYNIQTYYKLHKWKKNNGMYINKWFASISKFDSLISFSVFAYNNQYATSYPLIEEDIFCFKAKEMGHPLMPISRRVDNSIDISNSPNIIIITGANMAGKSTFLRTVATNLILAMNGSPVCAKELIFTPCDIMSSIKIQDSLSKNESYFYAEISRLKDIVNHVKSGKRTMVVLDEILRGTNTKDKQIGSLGLLKKLISNNSIVFIATHDLVIGDLEKTYPHIARNYCFEVELLDDRLTFDYKLKNGVSQKLNASFLLKKMDLID